MTEKILCVDDDANILSAYQRQLRRQFHIDTALGGEQALNAMTAQGPYAVVVADMRMPGMDGIQFLAQARQIAPDTVRMMLTGNADLKTAIDAVREGNIFRFLTKPCPPDVLSKALQAGVEQYRLIKAERDLLEKTLSGSIKVLTEILSMVDPESFGRALTLRDAARALSDALHVPNRWEVEVAAMLAPIGHVTIPSPLAAKARVGQPLSHEEQQVLSRVPEIGHNLLSNIPRLETVAQIVLYQNKRFDGSGFPQDAVAEENIPLGARMLKVLTDLVELEAGGMSKPDALRHMRSRIGWYDPQVLDAAFSVFVLPALDPSLACRPSGKLPVAQLRVGQVLLSDVETRDGHLLISAGYRISETLLERIKNYARLTGIKEPICVENTVSEEDAPAPKAHHDG